MTTNGINMESNRLSMIANLACSYSLLLEGGASREERSRREKRIARIVAGFNPLEAIYFAQQFVSWSYRPHTASQALTVLVNRLTEV